MATNEVRFPNDLRVVGNLRVDGDLPTVARSDLEQNTEAEYAIPLVSLRTHDALATNLPGTAAADDLAFDGGTFGTNSPKITTGDVKASTVTRYARFQFELPPEYDSAETVKIQVSAGMETNAADGTATIDFEVYKADREASVGSDICGTAAQSINSLTFADKEFTVTSSGLAAGDVLDIRMAIAVDDSATGTAVIGSVGALEMLLDIKG